MVKIERKTFICSDPHFYHNQIINYEPESRKGYKGVPTNDMSNLEELERMNEDIISEFGKLPSDCDVYLLGDIWFCGRSHTDWLLDRYGILKRMTERMKGKNRRLFLILGNHDILKFPNQSVMEFYYSLGFDKVYDTPIVIEDNIILSHEPVYISPANNFKNIHGHTHSLNIKEDYFCYDFENYAEQLREGKTPEIVYPNRKIDVSKYINVCWDNCHSILDLTKLI